MIIVDCDQGSEAWYQARLGVPTSSEFSKIITPAKGGYSTQAVAYMHKLIAEALTGKEATGFMSDWMERGKEMEEEARLWYELTQGVEVQRVGFIYRDERKDTGCSPDGLLESKGLEIKCVAPGTMVTYLLNGDIPREYVPQVQGSMWVTGLPEWDFLAYHPDFDPMLIPVKRDNDYISKMEMHIAKFNKERAEKLEKLLRHKEAA